MEQELVIYIHGVSPRGQKSHDAEYKKLHAGIRKVQPAFPAGYCGVEWGWHDFADDPKSHQLLSDAEENLGKRAIEAACDPTDFTINPLRIAVEKFRPLMMFNFADMFYYTSADGKFAVRYVVAQQILACLNALKPDPALLSLTLLGHSAGSIAAFDFLYFLFGPKRPVTKFIDPTKVTAPPSDAPNEGIAIGDTLGELEDLREMAQNDQLRVRRLFTFGSPIVPLAFRSDAVIEILAGSPTARLDVADYGLARNPATFSHTLQNPRWVNVWDKDDPIAWPVEPLMTQPGSIVKDRYVDVSDSAMKAHEAYWTSSSVHREFGKAW